VVKPGDDDSGGGGFIGGGPIVIVPIVPIEPIGPIEPVDAGPQTEDDFRKLFKKAKVWCKSGNESCEAWGSRIAGGLCRTFYNAVSVCIIAVQEEVTAGCPHVSKCP
jgi:hypothetical protein